MLPNTLVSAAASALTDRLRLALTLALGCAAVYLPASAQQPPTSAANPAAAHAGTPITVSGELTVLYADDTENRRAELKYFIEDKNSGRRYRLSFDGTPPGRLRSGQTVTARGRARGEDIVLAADDGSALQSLDGAATAAAAPVTGEQRTLVMVADFSDAAVSCTMGEIEDIMFTDLNHTLPSDVSW